MFEEAPSLFLKARNLSFLIALLLIGTSAYYGREAVFLLMNTDGGKLLDQFFKWVTWAAEGWVWLPYFIILFGLLKKEVKLILLNFILSTLLTQIPKNFIWEAVSRPIASGIPLNQIHRVPGVIMHSWNSFPSGHTATAFTLFLLTTYLFPNKFITILGLMYAVICAYSRVYLGQHFPMDLGGGMIVAILSMELSRRICQKISNSKNS